VTLPNESDFEPGDRVVLRAEGGWFDGMTGTILRPHALVEGMWTVVLDEEHEGATRAAAWPNEMEAIA
jgi:hypothetical protein